jgi:uncharacterized Fe-S cluster-containing radical SAM superfamily protein
MNAAYAKKLAESLPAGLREAADENMIASLGNSRVLLSKPAMAALESTFVQMGGEGPQLFQRTVQAIRTSMEAGLRSVFFVAAIAMLIAFFLICTVPEIPMDTEPQDNKSS